jgi:hypothetical protein
MGGCAIGSEPVGAQARLADAGLENPRSTKEAAPRLSPLLTDHRPGGAFSVQPGMDGDRGIIGVARSVAHPVG